jgi:ATP-dependent HslUV protease ATP-binding subunit HslU
MESLLEEVSFTATDIQGQTVTITENYVNERLKDIVEDQDLSRFIL